MATNTGVKGDYTEGMKDRKVVSIHLEPEDYGSLEGEAIRLGLSPATLARDYVRATLAGRTPERERQPQEGLAALERLAALTEDLPPVDAVRVSRQSRELLERRASLA